MKTKLSISFPAVLTASVVIYLAGVSTSSAQEPAPVPQASSSGAIPTFDSFIPIHGAPGTTVLITGDHLANATGVKFGVGGWDGKNPGVPAFSFHVVSDSQIEAVVPPRSYWGFIQVTTPGGTADTSGVKPVNYFWPDNLEISSGAGGPMFPVGSYLPLEPRSPPRPPRSRQRPPGNGAAPPPPGVGVDHPGDVYPSANSSASQAAGATGAAAQHPGEMPAASNGEPPEKYRLFLNEYNSSAPFVIDSDLGADYRISVSEIDDLHDWTRRYNGVGAYPAIFTGKHGRLGTAAGVNGLPILLSAIRGGGVLTSSFTADLAQVGDGGKWDSAWDMFLSTTPDGGQSYEIMVWLHRVNCQPIGKVQATVTIDGETFDVWQGEHTVSYVANPLKEGPDATLNIDVGKIMNDSIIRGYFPETWYLRDIEAGFEIWDHSANLVAKHFDVTYNKDAAPK